MVIPAVIIFLLLIGMGWATVRGKDLWPFSHYPMFSALAKVNDVEVYRLALETNEAEIVWWKSAFFRYPEFVGERLKKLLNSTPAGGKTVFITLQRDRYLAEVLRLILIEENNVENYRAFHIIRRTATWDKNGFQFQDRTIQRVPIEEITRIHLTN